MKEEIPPWRSFLIHSSSPPPQSYKECDAHRDQQSQFVTEVSHQQLAWRKGATWANPREHLGGMDSHLIWKFPMQNIFQPSFIDKGSQLGEMLFISWSETVFSALHKTTLHIFAPSKVFWHHYYQCSETFTIPIYSQKMASCKQQNEQRNVHRAIRKWSASLFMHKVYSVHVGVVVAYTSGSYWKYCITSKCPHPMGQEATIDSANDAKRTRPDRANTGTGGNVGRGFFKDGNGDAKPPFLSLEVIFRSGNLLQCK